MVTPRRHAQIGVRPPPTLTHKTLTQKNNTKTTQNFANKAPPMKTGPFLARTGPETIKNEIKMCPKNNFKKCQKNDTKWIILRLNNANKTPFCHSGETECNVKTIPKSQNDGEFLQQKGPFLTNFERCQKSDTNWSILRRNKANKTAFFVTTQCVTKSMSRTG